MLNNYKIVMHFCGKVATYYINDVNELEHIKNTSDRYVIMGGKNGMIVWR